MPSPNISIQQLQDFDQAISWPETTRVIEESLNYFEQNIATDRISISLKDPHSQQLSTFTKDKSIASLGPGPIDLLDLPTLQKRLSNKPLYVPDLDAKKNLTETESVLKNAGHKSYYSEPLTLNGQFTGSINLASRSTDGISSSIQKLLGFLSPRLALALHHSQIHDSLVQKEQALLVSEKEHRELIEQAGDAIFKATKAGRIVQVNLAASKLLGYSGKAFLDMHLTDLFSPETLQQKPLRFDLVLQGETVLSERKMVHKEGHYIPVEMNSRQLSSGNLISIVRDLSERDKAEQQIQSSKKQLVDAEEMARLGTWEYDFTQDLFIPSKNFCELFGFKKDQLEGSLSLFVKYIHKADQKNFEIALADAPLHKTTLSVTHRLLVNKRELWITLKGRLDTGLHRKTTVIVGSAQDVTDLYSTQKALRSSEAQARQQFQLLRSISDNTPNLVWAEDLSDRLTFVNKEFCRALLQLSSTSEPLGLTLNELAEKSKTDMGSGSLLHALLIFKKKDTEKIDETRQVDISGILHKKQVYLRLTRAWQRNYKGAISGAIYSGFDITEQVQQTMELENQNNQIQALLDAVPVPLYAKNISGRYILLNNSYLAFFGRDAESMLGKTMEESWDEKQIAQFRKDDKLLLDNNEKQTYTSTLVDGRGQERSVIINKARYFDASGKVAGLIGTLWDYSDLQAAEERYHNLFDLSPTPIVVHDSQSLLAVNQAALDFFGTDDSDAYIQRPVYEFIHPDFRDIAALRSKDVLLHNKANESMEQKFLTASGEARDVSVVAAPVHLATGTAVLASFRDITEEKRNRELLQKSEQSYRTLIDLTPNPVLVHADGKIIYANQAALEFGGQKKLSDLVGIDLLSFVHPSTREKSRLNLNKIQETGEPTAPGDQTYIRGDGEAREVESQAVPVVYEGQNAVLVSFVDNTEKRLAGKELQDSRRQLEMVTDHVTHFILLVDYDLNILYGNQSSADFFKLDKDEMIGLPAEKIIVEPGLQLVREHLAKMDTTPEQFSFIYEREQGPSSEYWVTLIPVIGQDGSSIAFLTQIEDITNREAARQELAENKELLELIIDTIPALVAYTDATEKLLFVNKAYADWHKLSKEELVGETIKKVLGAESYRDIQPHVQGVLSGDEQLFARTFIGKDKTPFVYEGSFIPHVDRNNQVKAFLTVLRDVGEQKHAEMIQAALHNLAHSLTEPMSVYEVGKKTALTIRSVYQSDAIAIEFFDRENQLNRGIYSEDTFEGRDTPEEVKSHDLPFAMLLPVHYAENYGAECVNRSEQEMSQQLKTVPFGDGRISRSLLSVPIRWEGKAIGLVSIQSYTYNKFQNDDLPLLQTFGDQIGGALMRARQDAKLLEHKAAVEREEQKYRAIIENAGDAVFVITTSGEILTVNESCLNSLGYSSADLLARDIKLINPNFFDSFDPNSFYQATPTEKTLTLFAEHIRKDETAFPVELRISTTEIDDKPCFLIFARDITERIRSESREIALRELAHNLNESKDMRAVGRMAANAIRGFFQSDAFAIEYYDFDQNIIVGVYTEDTLEPGAKQTELEPVDTKMDRVRDDFFTLNSAVHVRNRSAKELEKIQRSRPFGSGQLSHSLLFAPIVWGDKTVGILTVQSYTDNKYSESDLGDIQLFADQIGSALMRSKADTALMVQTNALLKSEQKLTSLLKEKDVLLKEVYHRTKNNMQVIVGFLDMQSYKTDNEQTLSVLKEMNDRISSMSMVHDLLYRSKSLADIRLDTYLHKLVSRLVAAYQSPHLDIETVIQAESLPINIQFAVPLGLVINEVITNALKYAFPNKKTGLLKVEAKTWQENGLELTIEDDGVGLDTEFNFDKSDSLGMKIIRDIVELQLLGELVLIRKKGLAYHISIPNINLDATVV